MSKLVNAEKEEVERFRALCPDMTPLDCRSWPEGHGPITAIRGEHPDARNIVLTTCAGDAQPCAR